MRVFVVRLVEVGPEHHDAAGGHAANDVSASSAEVQLKTESPFRASSYFNPGFNQASNYWPPFVLFTIFSKSFEKGGDAFRAEVFVKQFN